MLDWLIVGAGVHGTHHAVRLLAAGRVAPDRLTLLDPLPGLLARFRECTEATGTEYLRSAVVHHLDVAPMALQRYSERWRDRAGRSPLAGFRVQKPLLAMFFAHSEDVARAHRLEACRVTAQALRLERRAEGWRVETDRGGLDSRRVLLALGLSEQPVWPSWAVEARQSGCPVDHVFRPGFRRDALPPDEDLLVVGGGLSAAQLALALAAERPGRVELLMRHPQRLFDYDADPCWLGPKCLDAFHREPCLTRRRRQIQAARFRGSMPRATWLELRRAEDAGLLRRAEGEVEGLDGRGERLEVRLRRGETRTADRLLLATGFASHRPGGALLDQAIEDHDLPLAPCGYPRLARDLSWAPGLHATGPLAELEIGPVSRNIQGARLAAARLAGV